MRDDIAKIICKAAGDDWRQGKDYHRATADVVLSYLEKPTQQMIDAATASTSGCGVPDHDYDDDCAKWFTVMIRTAKAS